MQLCTRFNGASYDFQIEMKYEVTNMKKILNLIILLLLITGCTPLEPEEYLDVNGNYIKEKYLVYNGKRVEIRKERSPLNFFSKNEILPYLEQRESGDEYIGLEIRRLNSGIEEPLKLMTIIVDGEKYTYYLIFERSNFTSLVNGVVLEELHIEIEEKVLEKLSKAKEVKLKFTEYNSDTRTVVVSKDRKTSYKLIYDEYLKRKGSIFSRDNHEKKHFKKVKFS